MSHFPLSLDAYATHFPSGENWPFLTVDGPLRKRLLFNSGNVRDHNSCPFSYSTYWPSRDQSVGNLSASPWATTRSSCAPSTVFRYTSNMFFRLEAKITREASGLQTGIAATAGSNVSRFARSSRTAYVPTSVFWLPSSVLSTATDCPSGARETLA